MSVAKNTIVLGLPCPACLRGAVYFRERPMRMDFVTAKLTFNHDTKNQPRNGEEMKCQWCLFAIPMTLLLPRNVTIFDYETGGHV